MRPLVGRTVVGDVDAIACQDRNPPVVAASERAEQCPEKGNATARAEKELHRAIPAPPPPLAFGNDLQLEGRVQTAPNLSGRLHPSDRA